MVKHADGSLRPMMTPQRVAQAFPDQFVFTLAVAPLAHERPVYPSLCMFVFFWQCLMSLALIIKL